jgi:hypothetical protein
MGTFLFVITVLFVIFGIPILYIQWTIRGIMRLRKEFDLQAMEIESLRSKINHLRNRLFHLEESRPVAPTSESGQITTAPATPPVLPVPTVPAASQFPNTATQAPFSLLADQDFPATEAPSSPSEASHVIPTGDIPPEMAVSASDSGPSQIDPSHPLPLQAAPPTGAPGSSVPRKLSIPSKNAPADAKSSGSESIDWESLIGGDFMNKAGALLLIIGLGLFLNYTMAYLGPWIKIGMGCLLSLLFLAWGIVQDSRSGSRLFAGGLIGTGWAGLYLTAYAAHSLEAVKVIESPVLAMIILVAVAAGMIIHSLRFASETATGLAFLLAFVALLVGQVSLFTEIGAVIISVGLLLVALRHSWEQLALFGVVMTFGGMVLRLFLNAPPSTLPAWTRLFFLQGLLLIYWVTFEGIGMVFIRRLGAQIQATKFLFSLNVTAYLLVSLALWPDREEISWSYLAGLLAVQYAISGILRWLWCQNPGEEAVSQARYLQGSAEDGAALAVLAVSVWLWYVLPAPVVAVAWGVLAMFTLELALRLPWQFLRFIGHLLSTMTFIRTFIANFPAEGATGPVSHRLLSIVPLTALMGHLYLRTREDPSWEASPTGGSRVFSPVYLYFAFGLAAFLIRFEVGAGFTAPLWGMLGVALTLAGSRWQNIHLRRQGFIISIGALGYGLSADLHHPHAVGILGKRWFFGPVTISTLMATMLATPSHHTSADEVLPGLDVGRREILTLMASFLFGYLLYLEVDGGMLTVAWALMGSALLGCGFFLKDRFLRLTGLGTVLLCIGKIFLYDSRNLEAPLRILAFMGLGIVLLLISWVYSRFRDKLAELFK